jgi:hypothetical protein
MGVSNWLHCQATLRPGKESQLPEPGWTFYTDFLCVGNRVIQTTSWCSKEHTWGTQLLEVIQNTQLNLNLFNIPIHPSVSL